MTPFVKGATGAAMIMTATTAQAHDQYMGWQHHKTGQSCCSGVGHSPLGDCQPVKLCDRDKGFLEPGTGRCIPIQDHALTKPLPSMSQEPHACWRDGGARQFCVTMGPET